MTKYRFESESVSINSNTPFKISVEFEAEALPEILDNFSSFLRACTFSIGEIVHERNSEGGRYE